MNTTRPSKKKPESKPTPRSITKQELVTITEETIRDTVNTLNNMGKAIKLGIEVAIDIAKIFDKEKIVVRDDDRESRVIEPVAQVLAAVVAQKVLSKL